MRFDWLKKIIVIRQYLLGNYLRNDDQNWLCSLKMSIGGNTESKKWLMFVNPTVRVDTIVGLSLCSPSTFWKYTCRYFIFSKICSLVFTLNLSGIFSDRVMSGIWDLRFKWQSWVLEKKYPNDANVFAFITLGRCKNCSDDLDYLC